MALGPVEALLVPGDQFRRFVVSRPQVSQLVMMQLSERLRNADKRRTSASASVLKRLASLMIELADDADSREAGSAGIELPLSQTDLAIAVGATREAVAKALRLLWEEGLVTTAPRSITIANQEPLRLLSASSFTDSST